MGNSSMTTKPNNPEINNPVRSTPATNTSNNVLLSTCQSKLNEANVKTLQLQKTINTYNTKLDEVKKIMSTPSKQVCDNRVKKVKQSCINSVKQRIKQGTLPKGVDIDLEQVLDQEIQNQTGGENNENNENDEYYRQKYLKYKTKYLALKNTNF